MAADSTLKENMSGKDEVESPDEDLPLMPTANIFIKQEPDFEIVSISSIDECDDDNVINDHFSKEDINNDDHDSSLNDWPVSVNLETGGGNIDFDDEEIDCQDSNDNDTLSSDGSCKDTNESYSSSSDEHYSLNGRKRKKLIKMRKKRIKLETFCKLCGAKFNSVLEFNIHSLTSHNVQFNKSDDKFTCQLCKKQFHLKSLLTQHMTRTHTEERSINCIKCNKKFMYRSYLTSNQFYRKNINSKNSNNCYKQENKKFTCFHCVKTVGTV